LNRLRAIHHVLQYTYGKKPTIRDTFTVKFRLKFILYTLQEAMGLNYTSKKHLNIEVSCSNSNTIKKD